MKDEEIKLEEIDVSHTLGGYYLFVPEQNSNGSDDGDNFVLP